MLAVHKKKIKLISTIICLQNQYRKTSAATMLTFTDMDMDTSVSHRRVKQFFFGNCWNVMLIKTKIVIRISS